MNAQVWNQGSRTRRTLATVLALALGSLFLAIGCGDDSPTDPPDTAGNTPTVESAPPEWWGVWITSTSEPAARRETIQGEFADTVSICEQFDPALWLGRFIDEVTRQILPAGCTLEASSVCDAEWSSRSFGYDCVFEGTMTCSTGPCSATWTFTGTGARMNNAMSVEHIVHVTQSGPAACQADTTLTFLTTGQRINTEPDLSICPGAPDTTTTPNFVTCTINTGSDELLFIAEDKSIIATWNETAGHRITALYSEVRIGAGIRQYQITVALPPQTSLPVTIPVTTQQVEGSPYVIYEEFSEEISSLLLGSGSVRVTQSQSNLLIATFEFAGDLDGDISGTRSITGGFLDVGTITPR